MNNALWPLHYSTGLSCFVDINECGHENGGCDHGCTDTQGSYYCDCRDGYYASGLGDHVCLGKFEVFIVPLGL